MPRSSKILVGFTLLLLIGVVTPSFVAGNESRSPSLGQVGTADTNAGSPDQVFVPTDPCRVVDTRFGGGGRLSVGTVRAFSVRDEPNSATSFEDQGGNAGPCGVSPLAVSVQVSITAVDPDGRGFVRVYPWADPTPSAPNATFLNYSTALNATNAGAVKVCNEFFTGSDPCTDDLLVRNFGARTNLIIDVFGYFVKQAFATVDGETGDLIDSYYAFSSEQTADGEYEVGFAQTLSGCAVTGSIHEATGQITVTKGLDEEFVVLVETADSDGTASDRTFTIFLRC